MNVKVTKPENIEGSFPKLMILEKTSEVYTIALFTSEANGVILSTTDGDMSGLTCLFENDFKLFKTFHGKIELSNK